MKRKFVVLAFCVLAFPFFGSLIPSWSGDGVLASQATASAGETAKMPRSSDTQAPFLLEPPIAFLQGHSRSSTPSSVEQGSPQMPAKKERSKEELSAIKPKNANLRQELVAMMEEDQRYRSKGQRIVEAKGTGSPEFKAAWEKQAALDKKNQERLAEIVREHGWPELDLVGLDGALAAFLILQHADSAEQKRYLPMLQAALEKGQTRAAWVAMLEDRILMADGKPQIYGSQLRRTADSKGLELYPIEDEEHVDQRRKAVGLPPMKEYLKNFGLDYVPPKKKP